MIYDLIFKLFLKHIDAEWIHDFALGALRVVTAPPPLRAVIRRVTAPHDRALEVNTLGLRFPSPLGVAAGMDKDARSFRALWSLGFGFVEVGTITTHKQEGYPRPRIYRSLADRAVINRMGFPNPGAVVAAQRIRSRHANVMLGVNVGKSMITAPEETGDDYRACVRDIAPVCDYLVINVSSPNTPGLVEMQAVALLRSLIADVRSELHAVGIHRPILIKIGPDLTEDELDAVADLAVELELDGIVATNTTLDRSGLTATSDKVAALPGGGVSGAPLKEKSLEVLRRLYRRVGKSLVLVSVGGVATPQDTWERIAAGATLVQSHTGFIYGGPAWPRKVNRALARRVRREGFASIQDAVGIEARNDGVSLGTDNAVVTLGVGSDRGHERSRVA